jgi:hypothetical protein
VMELVGSRFHVYDLYSGGAVFDPRPKHQLPEIPRGFLKEK